MATPRELLGHEGERKAENLLAADLADRPLGVQILPRQADLLIEAVAMVAARPAADLVDLNFACPSRRVAGRSKRGAAFLRDPDAAVRLVEAAVGASDLPVTVKLRHGYTNAAEDRRLALDLARGAAQAGAVAVTVHARSAAQKYTHRADWTIIAEWAEALPVPVFGSGDLKTPEAVLAMLRETGCEGASMARGAFGTPWIFRQVLELAETGTYRPVTSAERGRVFLEHYDALVAQYGEVVGLRYIRQIGRVYARDIPGAAEARARIQHARCGDDIRRVAEKWFGLPF
jgi:nifR3 family TIM-barrel protein